MRRRALFQTLLLALLFLTSIPRAQAKDGKEAAEIDRIVAVAGSEIVLLSEVERLATSFGESGQRPEARRRILDRLVDQRLIAAAAKAAGITVTAKEIDDTLKNIIAQNKLSEKQFQKALSDQGYTRASYREELRGQLLMLKATNHFIRPSVIVTDAEVLAHYKRLKKKEPGIKEFDEIEDQLRAQVSQEEVQKQSASWIQSLRKKVIIDVRL